MSQEPSELLQSLEQIRDRIDDAYDASALLEVSERALDDFMQRFPVIENSVVASAARTLAQANKNIGLIIDFLEKAEMKIGKPA